VNHEQDGIGYLPLDFRFNNPFPEETLNKGRNETHAIGYILQSHSVCEVYVKFR
jgi:hypothetical protein